MMLTLEAVDEILQGEDVEGLLALGAPCDEYASEAQAIHSALISQGEAAWSYRDLCELILKVWDHSFGPFGVDEIAKRQPAVERLVQRLLARAATARVSQPRAAAIGERL